MADTRRKMIDLTGTLFADGQTAKSITPQDVRDLIETVKTSYMVSNTSTPATHTVSATTTWDPYIGTDSLIAGSGFTRNSAGAYQFDGAPVNSVSLANDTQNFLCLGMASVEPLTAASEISFTFSVDGTEVTATQQSQYLPTLLQPEVVCWGGVLPALASGEVVTTEIYNLTSGNDITINNLTTILIGLND